MKFNRKSILYLISFVGIILFNCSDEPAPHVPDARTLEKYILTISPESHVFTAEGGEMGFEITAEKTTTTFIDGEIESVVTEEASYTLTSVGEWFNIDGDKIIAEENVNGEREGSITVKLDDYNAEKTINLTQEGIVVAKEITNIKVLAIGNSFSADAVEQYLYELAEANSDTILIGNMYIGGASLQTHYNNYQNKSSNYSYRKIEKGKKTTTNNFSLLNAIKDEKWDYISLQQSSTNSGLYNTYIPYLKYLIDFIKQNATNPNVEIVFHSTWAYATTSNHAGFANYNNNQQAMYEAIIDATKKVEADYISQIIPAGTAIQNGRSSSLGDTFCRDGYHLETTYGRYTAACTWYEALFQKNVIGNQYYPATITAFQAKVAQQAAHNAIENPYEATSLDWIEDDTPIVDFIGDKINISLGSNPNHKQWNYLSTYTAGSKIENLVDSDGNITKISITVIDRFGGINKNGPSTTSTDMDMNSAASSESFFGNREVFGTAAYPKATIKISSLDSSKTYNLLFYAGRTGASDNREAYYELSGHTKADTTLYLNASNNTTKTVKAVNIRPDSNGDISIEVGPGPNNTNTTGFYYISTISIEQHK